MLAPMTDADRALLERLERYYDAVPRSRTRTEEVGPFTLFIAETGWPYYARPRLGGSRPIDADDVRRLLQRQRDLGVPQSIEWVHQITPELLAAVRSVDVHVDECPLLVLDGDPRGAAGTARVLDPDDPDLPASLAAISIGFGQAGTATGPAGVAERNAETAAKADSLDDGRRSHMEAGRLFHAAVFAADPSVSGPVGGGSYSPVGDVAEIAGVGVLPAFRRRGLAAQLTYVLAVHARRRGVTTVFCSAESADVARVYERVGFRRVGTACIASADVT